MAFDDIFICVKAQKLVVVGLVFEVMTLRSKYENYDSTEVGPGVFRITIYRPLPWLHAQKDGHPGPIFGQAPQLRVVNKHIRIGLENRRPHCGPVS